MAGKKLFSNQTDVDLEVTIYVRAGSEPGRPDAGSQKFRLPAHAEQWITYGDDNNVYLNGLGFFADEGTQATSESRFVVVRSADFDNLLNTNDTLTFQSADIDGLVGSNTWS